MIPYFLSCNLITNRAADRWRHPSRCVLVSHWSMKSHYTCWFIVVYCSPWTLYWIHCGSVQPLTGSDGLQEQPLVCRLEHNHCVVHGGCGQVPRLVGNKVTESQLKSPLALFVLNPHVNRLKMQVWQVWFTGSARVSSSTVNSFYLHWLVSVAMFFFCCCCFFFSWKNGVVPQWSDMWWFLLSGSPSRMCSGAAR